MSIQFSTRGPRNTIVLERKALAIKEVTDLVCNRHSMKRISKVFNITFDEIIACINAQVDHMTLSENEEIEMSTSVGNDEVMCDTVGITDGAFLSVIDYAFQHSHEFLKEEIVDLNIVYATGIEMILFDCLLDIKAGDIHYVEVSEIHKLVLTAFEKANEPINEKNIGYVLEQLGFNDPDRWGETLH